jgi:copper chaperone CopZ
MKTFKQWANMHESVDVKTIKDEIEDVEGVDAVEKILKSHDIEYHKKNVNGEDFIGFSDGENDYIIHDMNYVPEIEKLINFVYSTKAEEMYNESKFNDEFWSSPAPLFHATKEENWRMIQRDGQISKKCESRGVTNRGVSCAVFTTENIRELQDGSYGNIILEIDTLMMKNDGFTPLVSREPDVEKEEQINSLVSRLGYHTNISVHSGWDVSPATVIVHDKIPIKYVKIPKP